METKRHILCQAQKLPFLTIAFLLSILAFPTDISKVIYKSLTAELLIVFVITSAQYGPSNAPLKSFLLTGRVPPFLCFVFAEFRSRGLFSDHVTLSH